MLCWLPRIPFWPYASRKFDVLASHLPRLLLLLWDFLPAKRGSQLCVSVEYSEANLWFAEGGPKFTGYVPANSDHKHEGPVRLRSWRDRVVMVNHVGSVVSAVREAPRLEENACVQVFGGLKRKYTSVSGKSAEYRQYWRFLPLKSGFMNPDRASRLRFD